MSEACERSLLARAIRACNETQNALRCASDRSFLSLRLGSEASGNCEFLDASLFECIGSGETRNSETGIAARNCHYCLPHERDELAILSQRAK